MFVVDTNVLVYAADTDSPFHSRARTLLEGWRRDEGVWYLTWGVVYEFLRVTTHARVFRRPWTAAAAWDFVDALFASPGLQVLTETDRHAAVCAEFVAQHPFIAGNLVHDAHTAVLMKEHGVRVVYTRDLDFHRFGFVEVRDPFVETG